MRHIWYIYYTIHRVHKLIDQAKEAVFDTKFIVRREKTRTFLWILLPLAVLCCCHCRRRRRHRRYKYVDCVVPNMNKSFSLQTKQIQLWNGRALTKWKNKTSILLHDAIAFERWLLNDLQKLYYVRLAVSAWRLVLSAISLCLHMFRLAIVKFGAFNCEIALDWALYSNDGGGGGATDRFVLIPRLNFVRLYHVSIKSNERWQCHWRWCS